MERVTGQNPSSGWGAPRQTPEAKSEEASTSMYPVVLALLAALLFGAATPACKALLTGMDPVQLAGWLYIGAALGVAPGMMRAGGLRALRQIDRKNLKRLSGAVIFGGVLGPVTLLFGLRLASAASVSLWLNLELVGTALLGHFVFRDYLGRYGWAAVSGILLAGILLTVGEGTSGALAGSLVALACFFWALDNHFPALIDGITPAQSTFVKGLIAGTFNLTVAAISGASFPGLSPAGGALLVGTLAYGASIALFITAAQQLGATRAQMLFATAPFFGAGLSAIVLGESLGATHLIAAALLAAALLFMHRDRRVHSHAHAHEAIEHRHSHRHDDGHHNHVHTGMPPGKRHSHRHRHEATVHSHPHWPDLHHRHDHGKEGETESDGENRPAQD